METKLKTIAELRASGYKPLPVREEMRRNLISKIKAGENMFPGIVGYDSTVIPQIENAIISGQDIIFLGERGQAKSRIMRQLVSLLDEKIPVIKGCEINDNPFAPVCRQCRDRLAREGEATEISWLSREERYGEKLATPDITIADLIGDVDPIKVAEGRYLSDELTIHYGLIPRSNRGIFAINELPDLAERIQVGLFNLMEERDLQIRGYRVRLPLDVYVVASANPEDYTSRGRVITPLKDRYGAQIRTHYPMTIEDEITIMEMERRQFTADGLETYVPPYIKEIIAELTHAARHSPDINQGSGVSVRMSIANYETVLGNALRRAIRLRENLAVPRVSDLAYVHASTSGKIELEGFEEVKNERVIDELIGKAVKSVFGRYFRLERLAMILAAFEQGLSVETSDMLPARDYLGIVHDIDGMVEAVGAVDKSEKPERVAAAVEFILEGLCVNEKLRKTEVGGKAVYRH
ncbi:MAG: magnesium chelatase [Chloroflexota bacterium]